MQHSYIVAAGYALLAVSFVLLLDFQSFRCMFLALTPVGLGLIQLFGIMGWLNVPLNPANMIVLPLILGIGIDDGVHVVHDYRRQQGRYKLSASTATAVLITSLTTMMGFGSLMLAGHRGLQSLGRVLTIGVCCCLFTSIVLLPALLAWFTRHRPNAESSEPVEPQETASPRAAPVLRRVDEPHDRGESAAQGPAAPRRARPRRSVADPRRP
jgi:predicted RND superfamily exporter protein